jgi:hypothetical protein
MNVRENMLQIIRGHTPAGLLFVPRLDIWYNRNKARRTLPEGLEDKSLPEILESLGLGLHSVVPDFIRSAPEEDIHHRSLGFYNNPEFPYRVDFSAVTFDVKKTEDELKVRYYGSRGEITTACRFGRELFDSGVSIPDITEHAIKSPEDYPVLADILSKVRILPRPDGYQAYQNRVGERGVAVAFASLACGPMQHIMRDLRKYEEFCCDLFDEVPGLQELAESLAALYEGMIDSAARSAAEVVLFGANYDEAVTSPPFFDGQIIPWLNRAADRLHGAGKVLLTHTDGENKGLMPLFEKCRFDIADSICPAPMTKVSFREYREAFGKRITIWGGVPSNLMLKNCCSEEHFRRFVGALIQDAKPYNNLILSVADTMPPDADVGRIRHLVDMCRKTFDGEGYP